MCKYGYFVKTLTMFFLENSKSIYQTFFLFKRQVPVTIQSFSESLKFYLWVVFFKFPQTINDILVIICKLNSVFNFKKVSCRFNEFWHASEDEARLRERQKNKESFRPSDRQRVAASAVWWFANNKCMRREFPQQQLGKRAVEPDYCPQMRQTQTTMYCEDLNQTVRYFTDHTRQIQ